MSDTNILTKIIAFLKTDSDINDSVDSIQVESLPVKVKNAKITMRAEYGESSENGTDEVKVLINIWVNSKQYSDAFKTMKGIKEKVRAKLNFSGANLTGSGLTIYGIKKFSSGDIYEEKTGLWRGLIIFIVNESET